MLVPVQKCIVARIIFSFLLVSTSAWADVEQKAIAMKFLSKQLDVSAILKLQKEMIMSKDPKKLSEQPAAICFQVNIDNYLLKKSAGDKKVYGCIFSDQVSMNAALLRAGLFIHTDAGMTSDAELFNSKMMTAVGGHDFLGKELVKFHQNAIIPKESAPEHERLKYIEQQFKKEILNKIISENKEDFIFFAVVNTKKFQENITHELLHAQYYNVPEIAPLLLQVWQTLVIPQDQKIIVNALQSGGYDMKQQELLLREFYSYFLQYNAEDYLKNTKALADISPLVNLYAPHITKAFAEQHIRVISIHE